MENPSISGILRRCSSHATPEKLSSPFHKKIVSDQVIIIANEGGEGVLENDSTNDDQSGSEVKEDDTNRDVLSDKSTSLRFHEAAIFMEEGLDFEDPHITWTPTLLCEWVLRRRKILYLIDLVASVLLLLLAFTEKPCVPAMEVDILVSCVVEIACVLAKLFSIALRTRWHWRKSWLKHKMEVIRCLILGVMLLEVMAVLARGESHLRITRAARPLLLFDNFYLRGIRRFLRLIMETMPPVFEILGLMMFFVMIYSVFGFYLLGPDSSDGGSPYFQSSSSSFINLFVLLTTANFPDIMMPSYSDSFYYSLFFVSYVIINVYFFMNLTLTVVYNTFTDVEDETFKKMFMNKFKASKLAFDLLAENNSEVSYKDFKQFMKIFSPLKTSIDILLMFIFLDQDKSGGLNQDEFVRVYDAMSYNWKVSNPPGNTWFGQNIASVIIGHPIFEYIIYSTIVLNGILMIIQAEFSSDQNVSAVSQTLGSIFIIMYCVEVTLKLIGLGVHGYFHSPWNSFDFSLTLVGVLEAFFVGITAVQTREVIWIRLLRFLRILRIKKRFRDVFGTATILVPQLLSATLVMLMIYYVFAIIGMEFFSEYDLKNCCKNTSLEFHFAFTSENGTTSSVQQGLYYLNNFTNIQVSFVTLFELTVVNNWHVIMEGYAWKGGDWTRIYFIFFYILTLIVLTIVIASILEAFLFRIQYKNILKKRDEMGRMNVKLDVRLEDLDAESKPGTLSHWVMAKCYRWSRDSAIVAFTGKKRKTREDLQAILYEEDIVMWRREASEFGTINLLGRKESVNMRKKRVLSMESSTRNVTSWNPSQLTASNLAQLFSPVGASAQPGGGNNECGDIQLQSDFLTVPKYSHSSETQSDFLTVTKYLHSSETQSDFLRDPKYPHSSETQSHFLNVSKYSHSAETQSDFLRDTKYPHSAEARSEFLTVPKSSYSAETPASSSELFPDRKRSRVSFEVSPSKRSVGSVEGSNISRRNFESARKRSIKSSTQSPTRKGADISYKLSPVLATKYMKTNK